MNEPNNPRRRTGENQPSSEVPKTRDSHTRSLNTRSSQSPSHPSSSSSSSQNRRRRPPAPPQSQSLNWRSLLMIALVCALTGFVVILVYEWYKKNERIETIRTFEQEQAAKKEAVIQSALFAERMREALLRSSMAKAHITDHYVNYGVMPSNFSQLGISREELMPSEWVENLTIEEDGSLVFTFSPQTGDKKGIIKLTPIVSHGAMRWTCSTPDYAQIRDILHECTYTGEGADEKARSAPIPPPDSERTIRTPVAHDLNTRLREINAQVKQEIHPIKFNYIEPTNGPKARLRVSGGYFTGTPNLICIAGFRGHPDELKKMLEDAGSDVKLAPFVDEFGVLLGTDYRPGYKGRKIGVPASDLNTQETQAEVYIAAGKPFTLGFSADTKQGTVCGQSITFTPRVNKNYEAIGEITQNEEGKIVGCKMSIYEISGGASKSVDTQGQCLGPASFSRILGR